MTISRRQFIKRTGLASAGALLGPSFFRNPFLRQAFAANLDALDRYFVVIFLDGGNDGLNTVTPLADGSSGTLRTAYQAARSTLRLSVSDLTPGAIGTDFNTGTPLALHPGFIGLKHLWDLGALSVIQGCGDPTSLNLLSHEFSRNVWQTGNPAGDAGYLGGWVGRYLAANYGGGEVPGVTIGNSVAAEFAQSSTNVLAVRRVADFAFPYDADYPSDLSFKRDCFFDLANEASAAAQPTLRYVGATAGATLAASESYPPLSDMYVADRPGFDQTYNNLGSGFAQDLREVAKIIYGVESGVMSVNARSFELSNRGYDTHSNQGTTGGGDLHNQLLREVGDAVEAFYNDCADMGVANKLCVVVWSEFARRIQQNGSGTDHGSQGPIFVIGGPAGSGGALHGGVYGNHPDINDAALNGEGNTVYSQAVGDPFRSTDIRDVYGTLLKHWLGIADPSALLPVDVGDPSSYWTAPNFDLGFLT